MSNEQYAQYFTIGLKITICLPTDSNEMFRDWAIVEALEEDIVTLQLSRDQLPAAVRLADGIVFDLRLGKEGKGFRCSGYFAGKGESGEIKVRLSGDVGTSELREFFRIDVFLPFRYEFSIEQNLDVLIGKWRKKKKNRLAEETARREAFVEKHRGLIFRTATGELDTENNEHLNSKERAVEEFNPIDETWDIVNATAMNLSAGGFKFVTTDVFKKDELIFVEMFIPSTPPRIMDCISQVVFKNNNYSIKDGEEYFNVAFNFVMIDDRDRDAIVTHISRVELYRIRQKGLLPILDTRDGAKKTISPLMMFIWVLISVALVIYVSFYFYGYTHRKVNNEIQDTFEEAVRKYRERTGSGYLWK